MKRMKAFTFLELLISILVITFSLILLYTLSTKITNVSTQNDYYASAFYNNMSALDILEKTLDETGSITKAMEAAYTESNKNVGRYKHDLEIKVEEIIIYQPTIDITAIDPVATPIDEDNDGITDYYRNQNTLYYAVKATNDSQSMSQHLPIYRVTINTTVRNESRARNEIQVLVSPNKGKLRY